jgi:hypothetical protein
MGSFYNNTGMSSLLGNDSVNILAATNTDNNSGYIVSTRYLATYPRNTLWHSKLRRLLLGNRAVNIPSQQYIVTAVFSVVRAESI